MKIYGVNIYPLIELLIITAIRKLNLLTRTDIANTQILCILANKVKPSLYCSNLLHLKISHYRNNKASNRFVKV